MTCPESQSWLVTELGLEPLAQGFHPDSPTTSHHHRPPQQAGSAWVGPGRIRAQGLIPRRLLASASWLVHPPAGGPRPVPLAGWHPRPGHPLTVVSPSRPQLRREGGCVLIRDRPLRGRPRGGWQPAPALSPRAPELQAGSLPGPQAREAVGTGCPPLPASPWSDGCQASCDPPSNLPGWHPAPGPCG